MSRCAALVWILTMNLYSYVALLSCAKANPEGKFTWYSMMASNNKHTVFLLPGGPNPSLTIRIRDLSVL